MTVAQTATEGRLAALPLCCLGWTCLFHPFPLSDSLPARLACIGNCKIHG
jgi:hypothetical protein